MSAKVIPREALEACEPWQLPSVEMPEEGGGPAHPGASGMHPPTAEQIEALQRQAYDEAFAQGYQDGMAAAQAQAKAQLEAQSKRLNDLMAALARPFEELDQQVEQELIGLVTAMVRQLVRRELRTDPGQVVAAVREALAALPVASRKVTLLLHPEDAALVREALTLSEGERPWHIIEDPMQSRGGCRVTTDTSYVDATVEGRVAAIIAAVFGGERAGDQCGPST